MDKTLQKVTLAKLASLLNEGTPWPFKGQVVALEDDEPEPCPDACWQCSARINGEE